MSIKGILGFFEDHIEKIVFVIISIICVWFFLTWVVISPNQVEYKGRKFMPGDLDEHIYTDAALPLKNRLQRPPEQTPAYEPEYYNFIKWLDSPLSNIKLDVFPPVAGNYDQERIQEDRKFGVPQVGEVTEPIAEHLRAVAYVPIEEVTANNNYDKARNEPNDIDIVTVQAKFDVRKLYENFFENYAGSNIQPEWQDPCSAKPIFAAVDLQRSQLLPDGSWTEWKRVPRAKIDSNKELFNIIEDVKGLTNGGMELRLLQYAQSKTMKNLLQPDSYVIASPKEEWFPPYLHEKFNKIRDDIEREDRRKAREDAEKERTDKTGRRGTTTAGGGARGGGGMGTRGGAGAGGIGAMFGNTGANQRGAGGRGGANVRGGARDTGRTGRTPTNAIPGSDTTSVADTTKPKEATVKDVEDEFKKLSVTTYNKLYNLTEPLLFWAIDDSVKPNNTYRYRVRLGV
ncbi:MAG: hypothetical protein ACYTE8_04225, partial [Planctomycetota bacterium]